MAAPLWKINRHVTVINRDVPVKGSCCQSVRAHLVLDRWPSSIPMEEFPMAKPSTGKYAFSSWQCVAVRGTGRDLNSEVPNIRDRCFTGVWL